MYVSDYGYAASPAYWTYYGYNSDSTKDYRAATTSNWMYMGLDEWTISRSAENSYFAFYVDEDVFVSHNGVYHDDHLPSSIGNGFGVRPSFNLLSSITYISGDETQNSPIIIN